MKKLAALAIIGAIACAAPARAESFSFSYSEGRYHPYAAYSYVTPPVAYYYPHGPVYVQRQVVRPYYAPVHHGWWNKNKWHDKRDRHDRRHHGHRHGHR